MYAPMPSHLGTERLLLRPWAGSDAGDLRALHAERGRGTPALGEMRDLIAKMSAAATGIALLPIERRAAGDCIGYCGLIVGAENAPSLRVLEKLGFERDRVSTEDSGEVVWLTRSLR